MGDTMRDFNCGACGAKNKNRDHATWKNDSARRCANRKCSARHHFYFLFNKPFDTFTGLYDGTYCIHWSYRPNIMWVRQGGSILLDNAKAMTYEKFLTFAKML